MIAKVIVLFRSYKEIPLGVLAKVALAMFHIIANPLTRTRIGFSKILASKCPRIDYQYATAQICINQVSRQCRLHLCYEGRRNISKNMSSRLIIFCLISFFVLYKTLILDSSILSLFFIENTFLRHKVCVITWKRFCCYDTKFAFLRCKVCVSI